MLIIIGFKILSQKNTFFFYYIVHSFKYSRYSNMKNDSPTSNLSTIIIWDEKYTYLIYHKFIIFIYVLIFYITRLAYIK